MVSLMLFTAALGPTTSPRVEASEPVDVEIPRHLTLAQAQDLLLRHGLDLLIADQQIEAGAGDRDVAGAVANPTVGAGYTRSFFSPGLYESASGWSATLGDSSALADALSGKRRLRGEVAGAALASAKMSRVDAERVIGLQLKETYFRAALATKAAAFATDVAASAGQTLELNRLRYKSGAISEVDLSKTEAAKLEADQAVDATANVLRQAKVDLSYLLGRRQTFTDFELDAAPLAISGTIELATSSAASLVRLAFEHRPDLKAQADQRTRAIASLALERRRRFPEMGVDLQYQQEGSGKRPADEGQGAAITPPTVFLGLTSTLPLFYQQQGEIRRAEADVRTQELALAKTRAQVVSDVDGALGSLLATQRQVRRVEGGLLEQARRTRDLVELQYKKGAASLLEYLDAQRIYIATNLEYFQDLNGYWSAVFQLEAAIGTEATK
jgi:outer membrane protein, heavy metal efflux system